MRRLSRSSFVAGLLATFVAVFTAATSAGAGTQGSSGQAAPSNTASPTIGGTAVVGSKLTGNVGTWRGHSIAFAPAWQRCDTAGASCTPISGAASLIYTVTVADRGATLRLLVNGSNKNGTTVATSAPTSTVTDPATATPPPPAVPAPSSTSAPQISGAAQVGATLTASNGTWSGSPTGYAVQWSRCGSTGSSCVVTPGATGWSYTAASGDAGSTLRATVTATNPAGSATAVSSPTGVIVAAAAPPATPAPPAPPASTAVPQISGVAQVGQTLSASTGTWSGSPTSYGYAWQRCDSAGSNCSVIAGAQAASYSLAAADAGSRVGVNVTASNVGGTTVATSALTAAVATQPVQTPPPPSTSRFGIAAGGNIQNFSSADLAHYMSLLQAEHVGWIRFDLNWNSIQNGGATSYNWTPFDNVVKAAQARGIRVLGLLVYTPSWARAAGTDSHTPPTNLADYAKFAGIAAQHYAQLGVHDYEIWNEPNLGGFWSPSPDPARYTQMLKLAYASVKNADPTANVISAGLAGYGAYNQADATHMNPINFLQQMYANGAKGSMDAVGWHPYAYPNGIAYALWSGWSQMAQTPTSARSVMIANGDGAKQLWATEFGEPTGTAANAVSEAVQAKYVTDAFAALKGVSWAGPAFIYNGWDNGTDLSNVEDNFGTIRHDWSLKPSYSAYQSAAAAG
jgi:polysaccharide biosynthesis protein PslG